MGCRVISLHSDARHPRRELIVGMAAIAGSVMLPARAQQTQKLPRVTWISAGGSPADEARYEQRMEARFNELGWFYKRNLQYEIRRYRGEPALLKLIAAEMAAMKCDAILAGENYVTGALLQAGVKTPIVAQVGSSMPELGLIASYARPGGNVTGLAWDQSTELVAKHLEFLKELIPGLTRMGGLVDPTAPGVHVLLEVGLRAAKKLGMTLINAEVKTLADIEMAYANLVSQRVQAMNVWPTGLTYVAMAKIIELNVRHKLPDMTAFRKATETGGLMSYGANIEDLYVRAIDYVDKILRGANPAELPVEQPTKYELIINMKRARELGLKVPTSLQIRADELIE